MPAAPVGGSESRLLPLTVDGLSFASSGRPILHALSCRIEAGQRTIILGANGSGKSVFMRLCHGLLTPTGGSVRWQQSPAPQRSQAMVFQRPVMLRRSARANLVFALRLAGFPRAERCQRAQHFLREVGLESVARSPARVLSGGEQQRLALARAWAMAPEVLFLDEPTANLDPGATRDVEAIIRRIDEGGTKIIMSTHSLGQARRLGDEILFLHEGRLLEQTPVDEFFKQPVTNEAAAFIADELPR